MMASHSTRWTVLAVLAAASCDHRGAAPGASGDGPGVADGPASDPTSADASDPCAGVVCDNPPNACHEATGTCADGICTYTPLDDGTTCDDGEPCTYGDACAAGSCAGTAPATEVVTTLPETATWSLTVDDAGTAHLFYVQEGALLHASRPSGGTWGFETVPSPGGASIHGVAATATPGALHVAFRDDDALTYARFDGTWTFETIEADLLPWLVSSGWFPAIAAGGGDVHVAYGSHPDGRQTLMHAARATDGTWSRDVVHPENPGAAEPAIAVDATGTVYLAYWRPSDRAIVFAERPVAGSWSFERLADTGGIVGGPALVLDEGGTPHVALEIVTFDPPQPPFGDVRRLRYGRRDLAGWTFEAVDGDDAHAPSLGIDSDGTVLLSYLAYVALPRGHAVRLGRRSPDGAWRIQTLEPSTAPWHESTVGETSLARSMEAVHVVYDWSESGAADPTASRSAQKRP